MPVSEKLDAYLNDEEGKQDVIDDVVDLAQDFHLLNLLGKSKFWEDDYAK